MHKSIRELLAVSSKQPLPNFASCICCTLTCELTWSKSVWLQEDQMPICPRRLGRWDLYRVSIYLVLPRAEPVLPATLDGSLTNQE